MKKDRQEKMFRHRKKFKVVAQILEREFPREQYKRGICHAIWARKKQLLWELYGIDWKSPAELNPTTRFD